MDMYHGSPTMINKPSIDYKNIHNDFSQGFYCTENKDLAKEWAVSSLRDGFCNKYALNTEHLNILNLNTVEYSILNWIAVLVNHRLFTSNTPIERRAMKYLIDNFYINVNAYDVIIGYRADDSYFDYAQSFIQNTISLDQLSKAMYLGKLEEQIVIKSEFAFSNLKYEGNEVAKSEEYFTLRNNRNKEANQYYLKMLEEDSDGLFIRDFRGGITNDDPRIPRNICK